MVDKRRPIDVFPAVRGGEPEPAHSFVFRVALQRQFANKEVRLADLALSGISVWNFCSGQHCLGRYLAEIEADHGRRPRGHVYLRHGLGKPARQIAAPIHDVEP